MARDSLLPEATAAADFPFELAATEGAVATESDETGAVAAGEGTLVADGEDGGLAGVSGLGTLASGGSGGDGAGPAATWRDLARPEGAEGGAGPPGALVAALPKLARAG